MTKHHYVYKSFEEGGKEYIGIRSCDCLPEEDTKYFGSFKDKSFTPAEKTILFVCETRKEVAEIEIELHDFFDVAVNPQFANKAKATSTKFDVTGVPHTKEWKKAKSKRRTTLTVWVSRTERCSVAQLPRRTKHIPRRQKVVTVGNFRTGSDGSGSPELDRGSGASGMTSCSRFHFLCCASITSSKHTAAERAAPTLCHSQLSVIV